MRQILSTAVTAVIVSLLTLTVAGAMAQSEPPASSTTISPSAVSDINADRVDGKHAVGAGAKIRQRAGKLVATDKHGFLPRNIVKPLWPLIQHMPAGFADGVDDGVTGLGVTTVTGSTSGVFGPGTSGFSTATCPVGSLLVGGGYQAGGFVEVGRAYEDNPNRWFVEGLNTSTSANRTITAYAYCLSVTPSSAIDG
jgi:hypothetical protein